MNFQEKFNEKIANYAKAFRIEDLNDANDKSTLDIMLKTEVMIDDLQQQIQDLMDEDPVANANSVKKLHDLLRDASTMIITYQRTLAIDRKTRKTEETASVADYIRTLKRDAKDFMDQRRIQVWCQDCKVMVGRIYPVHDHTAFNCSFQCSQCKKMIRARREDKDIFFDVRDSGWRRKHLAEIVPPRKGKIVEYTDEDELILSGEPEVNTDDAPELTAHVPEDDLELGQE